MKLNIIEYEIFKRFVCNNECLRSLERCDSIKIERERVGLINREQRGLMNEKFCQKI